MIFLLLILFRLMHSYVWSAKDILYSLLLHIRHIEIIEHVVSYFLLSFAGIVSSSSSNNIGINCFRRFFVVVVAAAFKRGKYVHNFVLVFMYECINDVDVAVLAFNVNICKYQYQRTRMRYFV